MGYMRKKDLIERFRGRRLFYFEDVIEAFGGDEGRRSIISRMNCLQRQGVVERLRRGVYTLAPELRLPELRRVSALGCADELYGPAYVSSWWAAGWYGLIAGMPAQVTAVCSRKSAAFTTSFGHISYRQMQPGLLFGYHTVEIGGQLVKLADKEKALLDLLYLEVHALKLRKFVNLRVNPFEYERLDYNLLSLYNRHFTHITGLGSWPASAAHFIFRLNRVSQFFKEV